MKQLSEDPWAADIPGKYQPGQIVTGTVTKLTNFGVFVGLENGLEGLLHISELSEQKVENPEDVVKEGEEIEVKILRVDADERKIGLSRKRLKWADDQIEADGAAAGDDDGPASALAKPAVSLKGGIGDDSGPLIKSADDVEEDADNAEVAPADAGQAD